MKLGKLFSALMLLGLMAAFSAFADDAATAPEKVGFMGWIAANAGAVVAIISATLGVIAMICKLTPSPKDDAVVAKILGFLNMIPTSKKK